MNYIISKFAHELRNPMTSLYSSIQFIEYEHPEVKDFKFWSNINDDIEYMNRLISDLSEYSKSETLHTSTFSLRALLEKVSLSFAAMIADSDVEYTSKIAPSINQITGDKTKLQEVFLNLLKNAYDASLPDKSIYLKATSTKDEILIHIKDTGCGMSEEQLKTIFEPFVTYKEQGTGLGLPICKQIVELHQGTISVSSKVNAGTTILIKLPLNM